MWKNFSSIGEKLTGQSGILALMDDLGRAMSIDPTMLMLGGGNPAAVLEIKALWRERMHELLAEGETFDKMLGAYDPPAGHPDFLAAMAALLQRECAWPVEPKNLAVTTGGQTACFFLFNLLAGKNDEGPPKKILLPLAPEYIGYADQGLGPEYFCACRPRLEWPEGESGKKFKYRVDFAAVRHALESEPIAALAVSRPTNPTGNVLTDEEMRQLDALAEEFGVPLIIDNAYGAPFPGVIFTPAQPFWSPRTILILSLSKFGLPGARTAVVVGPPEIASALAGMTAIVGLANNSIGQRLVLPLVQDGRLITLGRECLRPFYENKSRQAQAILSEIFDSDIDYAHHVSEGAFFLWLWFPRLSVTTQELYELLKKNGVLVVPGESFFYGLPPSEESWTPRQQCVRINISQPEPVVREGLTRIAQAVRAHQRA